MKQHQLKINMKFYRQPLQRNQGRHNMISAAHSGKTGWCSSSQMQKQSSLESSAQMELLQSGRVVRRAGTRLMRLSRDK